MPLILFGVDQNGQTHRVFDLINGIITSNKNSTKEKQMLTFLSAAYSSHREYSTVSSDNNEGYGAWWLSVADDLLRMT